MTKPESDAREAGQRVAYSGQLNIPAHLEVIGYALYFHKYSTWEGKGIHLEDFYVTPNYRHKGIGTKLLRRLAKVCLKKKINL